MRLPNAHLAIVERRKIAAYLLNPSHPDNGGKAQFFTDLGFSIEDWDILATALRQLALNAPVATSIESSYGHKYVVDGRIRTPSGKTPWVRAIWIIDRGATAPRLVTAYPHKPPESP